MHFRFFLWWLYFIRQRKKNYLLLLLVKELNHWIIVTVPLSEFNFVFSLTLVKIFNSFIKYKFYKTVKYFKIIKKDEHYLMRLLTSLDFNSEFWKMFTKGWWLLLMQCTTLKSWNVPLLLQVSWSSHSFWMLRFIHVCTLIICRKLNLAYNMFVWIL